MPKLKNSNETIWLILGANIQIFLGGLIEFYLEIEMNQMLKFFRSFEFLGK